MALPYLTDITTFCQTVVAPNITETILKSSALLFRLYKNKKDFSGGTFQDYPIWISKNTNAQAYTNGGTLKTAVVDQSTRLQFGRAMYNTAIVLYGSDFDANQGKGRVLNLVSEKSDKAIADMKDLIATDLFAAKGGTGDSKLEGLGNVVGDSTVSWGKIASADYSSWLPNGGYGYDNKTTTLTKLVLNKAFNACKVDEDKPTLMVTTDDIYANIEATWLQGQAQYLDPDMAKAGFAQIRYKGMVVLTDSHITSGGLYLLNEKHLWFAVSPKMNFKFIDFEEKIDQDLAIAHVRWYGNLAGDKRQAQGYMSAITAVS
jgi:hypothetical protein